VNSYDPLLDEIIARKKELHELFMKHYLEQELFSVNWWISVALLTLPLIIWWRTVDRKRLREIMIFGFACNMIATLLDILLSDYVMWEYTVTILPQISMLTPVDYAIVPTVGMYLYQRFPKWGAFLLASAVASAVMTFLCEPLAVSLHLYRLLKWEYVYSFPIYIAMYAAIKFFTHRVMRAEGTAGKLKK
jgi:hypothetical protein